MLHVFDKSHVVRGENNIQQSKSNFHMWNLHVFVSLYKNNKSVNAIRDFHFKFLQKM
jgi:hypothetical protein